MLISIYILCIKGLSTINRRRCYYLSSVYANFAMTSNFEAPLNLIARYVRTTTFA
jgi:hypothetical protein